MINRRPSLFVAAAAACLFSLSQSFSWMWEFLWVNWLPGACLAAALAVSGARSERTGWRWPLLMLFAGIAMVGFGNGVFAWFLIGCGWAFQRLFTPSKSGSSSPFRPGWMAISGNRRKPSVHAPFWYGGQGRRSDHQQRETRPTVIPTDMGTYIQV